MKRDRIVNRPVEPPQMAAALDLAMDGVQGAEARERLDISLRDMAISALARSKVVELIYPVWVEPPPETAAFASWAVGEAVEVLDRRPIHLLALIATYPFFGDAAAAAGRLLRSEGAVDSVKVRDRLKAKWGDRDAVTVATRKCLWTLKSFGALTGERGSTASIAGARFALAGEWALWAVAALLLTRSAGSIDPAEAESAPEFFFLDLVAPRSGAFPLLERSSSGHGRVSYSLAAR